MLDFPLAMKMNLGTKQATRTREKVRLSCLAMSGSPSVFLGVETMRLPLTT